FYGIKGGIFTITTGGAYHVRGPDGSFIGGDNEIGLALIMTIPLLRYIQLTAPYTWLRTGMSLAILLTAVAVVGSQSRGALVGLVAMGVFLWLKTRNKVFTSLLGIVAVFMVVNIMPQSWFDRISSIKTYEQDASATGRINSWHMAFNLAKDHPLVGGGFETFRKPTFAMYAPNPGDVHDSHSIYFEVLGEHGFVGFAIFLLLGWATWRSASWVIRTAKKDPERRWMADLAAMIQVSLVGYASAGAFLGLAYFDLYYTLIAVVVVLKVLLKTEIAANPRAVPASRRAPAVLGAQPVSQRNAVL
ncbi:MAG TPA: putative O-glycosylation ligase, exosortase A system-associated, partial [Candidatus Obscuribacterales bacterium]